MAPTACGLAGSSSGGSIRRICPQVLGDADQLHQVFVNLVINAQQVLLLRPDDRRIVITTLVGGQDVAVRPADNGAGMGEEVRRRIFEPFFTTKPQGEGTGIGLSVSLGIVEAHGGTIEVTSEAGEGTCFTVRLPIAPRADSVPEEPAFPEDMMTEAPLDPVG